MGEASNPGPLSKRRRVLRSRALQQSWAGFRVTHGQSTFRRSRSFRVRFDGGCRVEAPAGAKTSTFEDSTNQNTTKIPREDPQREEKRHEKTPGDRKRMKMGVGEGKKSAKFWAVRRRGGPVEGGRRRGGPPTHTPTHTNTPTHQHWGGPGGGGPHDWPPA